MTSLSVEPESGEAVLFGKNVSDLQTDVTVNEDSITGTLKYVTGYTDFSAETSEQEGNYLALKCDTNTDGAVVTVEVVGGTKGPVTLDADKNIVLLIKDKASQDVRVIATKGDQSIEKTYDLSGLTLEPEQEELDDLNEE